MTDKNGAVQKAEEFLAYCKANPDYRFWQALCNWSGAAFIYMTSPDGKQVDTWHLRD